MKYKARLLIPQSELEVINKYLNAETEEEFQGEDSTIINSAFFPNGMVMDIKCCGCQDESSWTEAVLFMPTKNGGLCEVGCTDVEETYLGDWELDFNGDTYVVVVEDGGDREDCIFEIEDGSVPGTPTVQA